MAFQYAVALTGGIGTGKSTASSLFMLNGFKIIDADKIAHSILNLSYIEIEELFGKKYIKNSKVDRKLLGQLIFSNKTEKIKLEKFIHPKIFDAIKIESTKLDRFKFPYLIDIPLFFERNNYPIDSSIVIYAPKDTQIKRVIDRDGFSKDETIQRVESQMDIDEKRKLATFVIDNSTSLKNLQSEIERVTKLIQKRQGEIDGV